MISNAAYRYSYDNMITNYNKTNSGLGLLHVPGGGISDWQRTWTKLYRYPNHPQLRSKYAASRQLPESWHSQATIQIIPLFPFPVFCLSRCYMATFSANYIISLYISRSAFSCATRIGTYSKFPFLNRTFWITRAVRPLILFYSAWSH